MSQSTASNEVDLDQEFIQVLAKLGLNNPKSSHTLIQDKSCTPEILPPTSSQTPVHNLPKPPKITVKVCIIGSGASALSAASTLLSNPSNKLYPRDIIILEASERIGGRIRTIDYVHKGGVGGDGGVTKVDVGASWVHGVGFGYEFGNDSDKVISSSSSSKSAPDSSINPLIPLIHAGGGKLIPITKGNPWMNPRKYLHENKPTSESLIALYVGGQTPIDRSITIATKQYNLLLYAISNIAQVAFHTSNGPILTSISLKQAIEVLRKSPPEDLGLLKMKELGDETRALVRFNLYLLEVWNSGNIDDLTVADFVRDFPGRELEKEPMTFSETLDHEDLSLENDNVGGGYGDFSGPHCMVEGGMEKVLSGLLLLEGLKDRIMIGERVVEIDYDYDYTAPLKLTSVEESAAATAAESQSKSLIRTATGLEVYAQIVICTIPLGVLKHSVDSVNENENKKEDEKLNDKFGHGDGGNCITFKPPLPPWKTASISSLKFGHYKKILLEFSSIFWSTKKPFIGCIRLTSVLKQKLEQAQRDKKRGNAGGDGGGSSGIDVGDKLWINNTWVNEGKPLLEVILVNASAQATHYKADKEVVNAVLEIMQITMSPALKFDADDCVGYHVSRFSEDELFRGSYSYSGLGTRSSDVVRLGKRVVGGGRGGVVCWAGEACSEEFQGSVHGALLSGVEVAEEVVGILSGEDVIGVRDDDDVKMAHEFEKEARGGIG